MRQHSRLRHHHVQLVTHAQRLLGRLDHPLVLPRWRAVIQLRRGPRRRPERAALDGVGECRPVPARTKPHLSKHKCKDVYHGDCWRESPKTEIEQQATEGQRWTVPAIASGGKDRTVSDERPKITRDRTAPAVLHQRVRQRQFTAKIYPSICRSAPFYTTSVGAARASGKAQPAIGLLLRIPRLGRRDQRLQRLLPPMLPTVRPLRRGPPHPDARSNQLL